MTWMRSLSWRGRIVLAACVVLAASVLYVLDEFVEDGNLDALAPGQVYRAGQLGWWEWGEVLGKMPFRTILNLRGAASGQPWYEEELGHAQERGTSHLDYKLSANQEPTLAQMEVLVGLMQMAEKPMLIHCKQGADRTGLASALYAYAVLGQPADEAAKQLSIRYGHFPWLTSRTGAMDRAFAAYVAAHPRTN